MKILFTSLLTLILHIATAQESYPVHRGQILFEGHDPVAYFDQMQIQGKEAYAFEMEGRRILFASEEHLKMFKEAPEKFMPAYGGWCAIAMADKTFVVPDYSLYKIQDGQLMFFAIRAFFNGLTQWEKNPAANKIRADTNYVMFFPKDP
ncbi:MAG: YHS domain-containing (seleno)protein [Bacteroidota bacterium]